MDEPHSDQSAKRRIVNPMLGSRPKIGFLPAELVLPWVGISFCLYLIVQGFFQAGFLPTTLAIAWGCSTWWILTGSRPWKFLSKFINAPNWTRGYVRYRSILDEPPQSQRKKSKRSKQKTQRRSRS